MKDVRKEILDAVKNILNREIGEDVEIEIFHPQEFSHGDFSTNIIFRIFHNFRQKYQNPKELAEFIAKQLQKKLPNIEKIQISPTGFINFWVSKNYLLEKLDQIITISDNFGKELYASSKTLAGKQKIMLEFADPNPFKEFHIGHLRNITLGESYARLLEFLGAEVWRVNYQGDVGLHVAKALYGLLQVRSEKLKAKSLREKSKLLGEGYARGARAYEEDKKAKREIEDINLKIYSKSDPALNKLWKEGRKWSLDHFEEIYRRVGTRYKRYYFESQTAESGREIVLSNIKNKIFEKHEGAVIFRGSHTRVFVTSEGYSTYEAKDLALAKMKFDDFAYDKSIIITANEQIEYFKVVLEAMEKVFPELAKKTVHKSFGFVRLKEGKMSSRSGSVVTGEWLLSEVKRRLQTRFREMDEETLEKVAVGAVKYSMLKFSRKSDIAFSFNESINLEGNSGPYLQYTYARTQHVLKRSQILNFKSQININFKNLNLKDEEHLLLRLFIRFPEIVKEAGENFAPNLLCNYMFELAQAFNNFYQRIQILNPRVSIENHPKCVQNVQDQDEDVLIQEVKGFRIALTFAASRLLSIGLFLLGIEAPQKM